MSKTNSTWTHKVVKAQRGSQGEWFRYRAAATFGNETDARQYAEQFAAEQAGVGGTKILVLTRKGADGGNLVASYPVAS